MRAGTRKWLHDPWASAQRADLQEILTAGWRVCGEDRAKKDREMGVREGKENRLSGDFMRGTGIALTGRSIRRRQEKSEAEKSLSMLSARQSS